MSLAKVVGLYVLGVLLVITVLWFHWTGECEARGGTVHGNIVSAAKCVGASK